jgi:hypothetical protein
MVAWAADTSDADGLDAVLRRWAGAPVHAPAA